MRPKRSLLYAWLSVGLAACLPVPKEDMPKVEESLHLDTVTAETTETGYIQKGSWPSQKWWRSLGDPVLNELEEAAIAGSPTLVRAEERLKAAMQVAIEARAKLFPEVNFDGNTNWQHFSKYGFYRSLAPTVPAVLNDITAGLNFLYEFDFWGKNRALYHAALGTSNALLAERLQAELILTTSIGYAYAELQLLFKQKTLLIEKEKHLKEIVAIRGKREKYALDTIMDNLRARSTALDAEAAIADINQKISLQIHQLKALSGLGQDAAIDFKYRPINALAVFVPENLSLDLLSRRPDLIAEKARVEAAAYEVGAAKTLFYPNINLNAFGGLESLHWNKLLKAASFSGSLEPAIHLPIFTAGRIRANWKEKIALFNEAVASYHELILKGAQDVADQLSTIVTLEKEIGIRQDTVDVATGLEIASHRRLNHAIDDKIQYLKTKVGVVDAKLLFSEVEYGKQLANILLIRALGGGLYD